MNHNMVSEYSRQIKIRIVHSLSVLVLSFMTMFLAYERFFACGGQFHIRANDIINAIPFVLFLLLKEKYFTHNWIIKCYMGMSLIFFVATTLSFSNPNSHSLFPVFYPLGVIMYIKGRKPSFLILFFLSIILVEIVSLSAPGGSLLMSLVHLLSSIVIVLFCIFIDVNINRIGRNVTFIRYADDKTNLPNRDRFIHDLYQCREKNIVAILNVDGFKYINDLHGHYIGDALLISIGKMLCDVFPEWQIYRLSGSEFGLMDCHSGEAVKEKLKKIRIPFLNNSASIVNVEGVELPVGLSMGVAMEGCEGTTRKNILVNTDIALQEAKSSRSKFCSYRKDNVLKKKMSENHLWEKKIDEAFKFDRFCAYYQPIICNETAVIKKYECLARFNDSDGTVHSPKIFLPYLRSTKYYSKLTRTMINKCFSTLENISCDLSLNLSVEDLNDPFTMQYIILMLNNHRELAHRIQFEILETSHIDDMEKAASSLAQLKQYDCLIALDDFGSGYSNFEYLTQLHVDCIKIDGSLIQRICSDEASYGMVRNIVKFCRDLGVEIVAEYVSDERIHDRVVEMGIDYSQGYHIGKPRSLEALLADTGDTEEPVQSLDA